MASKKAYKAAAIIDIDWFKKVNDEYGHSAGDQTLKHFAKLLNHCCNINKFIIGRVGGEEFAIFCATTEVDDMVEALASLKKLLSNSPVVMDELEFKITFSAGYIVSHDDVVDVHDLLAFADQALYDAKKTGRDKIVEFLG
ncbi:MAG: GGDEF domain-containing protein [Emcibacter sp.]|nr:GGDEF domain-containing protein [Emcibacter sp.]